MPRPRTVGVPCEDERLLTSNLDATDGQAAVHDVLVDLMSTSLFKHEGGRRYLRDPSLPYPLPVDLVEVHRQSLRMLLMMRLWGAPFCNTELNEDNPPKKVLELACGSGLWSSACHDYFKRHKHENISFTGLDIAPLAPDLRRSGVNWRYVQHDIRKHPFPFPDAEFDFIFLKDVGFCVNNMDFSGMPLQETARLLKPGGVAEIWESDHVFRTLLPDPASPPGTLDDEIEQAEVNAVYIMSSGTPFVASQNRYLIDLNLWIERALAKRNLPPLPAH